MECTRYEIGDPPYEETWMNLCRCPQCKAWLPSDFPLDKPFTCKNCGAELMVFPDIDEMTGEDAEWGKICPISNRDSTPTPTGENDET